MNALASVSMLQLLNVWEELLLAKEGINGFGGTVCEVYIFRVMPYSPAAQNMPDSELADADYVKGNQALVEICEMFEEKHTVEIFFANPTQSKHQNRSAWIPMKDLLDLYIERHRLHIAVRKRE